MKNTVSLRSSRPFSTNASVRVERDSSSYASFPQPNEVGAFNRLILIFPRLDMVHSDEKNYRRWFCFPGAVGPFFPRFLR